jgi:hypothetical protein
VDYTDYMDYNTPRSEIPQYIDSDVTLFCKLGVTALKNLDNLYINWQLQTEIAAEIGKIPKFSTFIDCKVV